jgi:hypothetical protein
VIADADRQLLMMSVFAEQGKMYNPDNVNVSLEKE